MNALPTKALPLAAIALLCTSLTATAEEFSSVEEKMTGKEFMAAGLDKLSEEELAKLNAWLRENVQTETSGDQHYNARSNNNIGFDKDKQKRETIRTTIVGEFGGWDGDTVFELANGQAWQQTNGNSFNYTGEQPATVVIKPAAFGSWLLSVEGFNASIRVKRVR